MMDQRLRRSLTERMLAGICGGIAIYLRVDPVIIRLVFILVTISTGIGLLLYPLLWIVMPAPDAASEAAARTPAPPPPATGATIQLDPASVAQLERGAPSPRSRISWVGIALLGVGSTVLARELGIRLEMLLPVVLITTGIVLLLRR
jgi:phage shock protein C